MDALQSQDGITQGRANIKKAEIYFKASRADALKEADVRKMIEGDFGYGLRSFKLERGNWEDFK
jgi:hypothetical protein